MKFSAQKVKQGEVKVNKKNPNEIPDSISYDQLFKTIAPIQYEDGSVDFRDRCTCNFCLQERHQLCHDLKDRLVKVHKEVQEHNCPQRITRTVTEEQWREVSQDGYVRQNGAILSLYTPDKQNTLNNSKINVVPMQQVMSEMQSHLASALMSILGNTLPIQIIPVQFPQPNKDNDESTPEDTDQCGDN